MSGRETKLLVGTAQPGRGSASPGLSPVRGPRPAGHLDRHAPTLEPRVFRPETRLPAVRPSLAWRPPSPGRPPSPERPSPNPRGSPPPGRLPSSNPGGLHPPASLLPSSFFISPRLAPPRATCTALLPSLLRPAPRPLSFLLKPWSPLPPPPRPPDHLSPPSFPISPSLLRPRVCLSPSQLLSGLGSCPSPGLGRRCLSPAKIYAAGRAPALGSSEGTQLGARSGPGSYRRPLWFRQVPRRLQANRP